MNNNRQSRKDTGRLNYYYALYLRFIQCKLNTKRYKLYHFRRITANILFSFTLFIFAFSAYEPTAHAASFRIVEGEKWHYFKGIEEPPDKWHYVSFDHLRWQTGQTGFGYGNGHYRTHLNDMQGTYLTLYARRVFTITNPTAVTEMTLSVVCDGPFKAYLNGIEVIRTNTVQVTPPNSSMGKPLAEPLNISGFAHELMPGSNVLAVQCSNDDIDSGDFSFIPLLEVSGK
jgi:hypothetical protein